MKKISYIIASLSVLISCSAPKEECITLTGEIANPVEGGLIKLELIRNDELTVADSFYVDATNKFSLKVKVEEPSFYRINLYGRKYVNLILNDTDVNIKADINSQNGED